MFFSNTDNFFHLLGAAGSHGPFFQVKIILQADPGVASHQQCQITHGKLMTAGMNDYQPKNGRLRVATKFVNVTRRFFAEQGQQVEVIKLYGSMELGPIVGLSDLIVDVVDTGNTLKANGLKPIDHIADISSRLVVNKASLKMKHDRIQTMVDQMRKAVKA